MDYYRVPARLAYGDLFNDLFDYVSTRQRHDGEWLIPLACSARLEGGSPPFLAGCFPLRF